ncbi:kynureninase [Dokdonia sp. Hel_I_53]|uniref:kynureninase n=1 Tax=Dokdonia sp. Hel_I_53 TaxID=1566287 RepID=UPI001198DF05|nr:kynureninase [Dokdonia sp. Hel_I_53]TVZ51955.1 kynureninase [Dokdonia sp. Hel_I_53]
MKYENNLAFAKAQDQQDPLKSYRDQFYIPVDNDENELIYFCGNSLGCQPKVVAQYIEQELNDWANLGVEGHFDAENPWMPYHEELAKPMAEIVGAKPHEVVVMNTLTTNLHLMMVSFYNPTKKRHKIVIESDAFPSDKYAVESQIRQRGFNPNDTLILWKPREGEELCRYEDLEAIVKEHGESIALLLIGNTNYYSGQFYPIQKITQLGHANGSKVGFDLAHGVGNIMPNLHKNGPDFAVWCTYKYLNSGPGSLGGCFVHERHHKDEKIQRFTGWWGQNKDTRFNMRKGFDPIPTAEGWQLSNPPILSMAAVKASLAIFAQAGMKNIREKSEKITGYLEFLIDDLNNDRISIITPSDPTQRGCQLSIQVKNADKSLHEQLTNAGVISDWREPDVIRVAPAPLYNSYQDVFEMVERLKNIL